LDWERKRGCTFSRPGDFHRHQAGTNGLPGNDISCLCLDPDGSFGFGTSGHGLARFYKGKWTRYSTDDGLGQQQALITSFEDGDGYLWIGSKRI